MPEKEGFLRNLYHTISEKIVAKLEPGSRRKTVSTIIESRNCGERPDDEISHHFRHIPAAAVKEILTGNKSRTSEQK